VGVHGRPDPAFAEWHLLDSVPLLDIPKTLTWTKPYEYSDGLSGLLLLTFKGFGVLPLIRVSRLVLAERDARATA
jgi:hypothetical protein